MDFKKFNEMFDVEGLKKDMEEVGNTEFKTVPAGDYEISIEKLELTTTKDGTKPMLSCWMKILVGDYEGQLLFYNQTINTGFGLVKTKEFLQSLESGLNITFDDFDQYETLVNNVYDSINGKHEYLVELTQTESKGNTYNNYKIKKVYDI